MVRVKVRLAYRVGYDMIRYDKRCYLNVRSKADIRGAIKKFCNFLPYLTRWSKLMVE